MYLPSTKELRTQVQDDLRYWTPSELIHHCEWVHTFSSRYVLVFAGTFSFIAGYIAAISTAPAHTLLALGQVLGFCIGWTLISSYQYQRESSTILKEQIRGIEHKQGISIPIVYTLPTSDRSEKDISLYLSSKYEN